MEKWSEVPPALKAGSLVSGTGILAASATWLLGGGTLPWYWVLGIALVAVVGVVGMLWLGLDWLERRRSKALRKSISDVAQRGGPSEGRESKATVAHLREKFRKGLDAQKGTELTKKPWYLVMGHPGTGKTFAVARSGIRFHDELNDPVQGVGGTRTIDWWFAKDAILVDTAGRYVEGARRGDREEQEKRRSEAGEQLRTFLSLLKRSRPHCPINGLILVVAATDLLTEDRADRTSRAKDLGTTLVKVQQELDVRFPVIVWITKCDKIAGFREYFRHVDGDDALCNQLFGWSAEAQNFDDNTSFNSNELSRGLDRIAVRLRERRWGLLRTLRPGNRESAADAACGLFGFPDAWEALVPALKEYLRAVFEEPGNKAPYLRGVYFNSAVTEGEALDLQLAQLRGETLKAVWSRELDEKEQKELGGGKIWSEDRTYFIRDTLKEKLFKEQGLVSRYTNAVTALRRAYGRMIAFGIVMVTLMVLWAVTAKGRLEDEILVESDRWQAVQAAVDSSDPARQQGLRVVERLEPGTSQPPVYRGQRLFANEALLSFYQALGNQVRQEIEPSVLFRWVPQRRLDVRRRERLWQALVTRFVINPVVTEAGLEMGKSWRTNISGAALEALIRWEAAVAAADPGTGAALLTNQSNSRFSLPLLRLLTANLPASPEFQPDRVPEDAEILDQLAAHLVARRAALPLLESGGSSDQAVASAVRRLTERTADAVRQATNQFGLIADLDRAQQRMSEAVASFGTAAVQLQPSPQFTAQSDARSFWLLGDSFQTNAYRLRDCQDAWRAVAAGVRGADGSVTNALQILVSRSMEAGFAEMIALTNRLGAIVGGGLSDDNAGVQLAIAVISQIAGESAELATPLETMSGALRDAAKAADEDFFRPVGNGSETKVSYRHYLYQQGLRLFDRRWVASENGLEEFRKASTGLGDALRSWCLRDDVIVMDRAVAMAVSNLMSVAQGYHQDRRGRLLVKQTGDFLRSNLGFPMERSSRTMMSLEEVRAARKDLQKKQIQLADLKLPTTELDRYLGLANLLLDDQGQPRSMVVRAYQQGKLPADAAGILTPAEDRTVGFTYRYMTMGEQKEAIDLVASDAKMTSQIAAAALPMKVRTAGGNEGTLSGVPAANQGQEWTVLRWLADLGGQGAAHSNRFTVGDGTNCVIYLRVTCPDNKPLAIGITLEGDAREWRSWFGWGAR